MKRIILAFIVLFLLMVNFSFAQGQSTEGSTPTVQQEKNNLQKDVQDKIDDLKERLATRVAEIRAKSKRAFHGTIVEKDDVTFSLENGENKTTIVVDDQTIIEQITASGKNTITASTLEVGEKITAFGILDLDQKTLIAKRVIVRKTPIMFYGTAKKVDQNKGIITVSDIGGEEYAFDYEIRTKCVIWDSGEKKLSSCGLSKISEGDFIFARVQPKEEGEEVYTVLRILVLPSEKPSE